MFKYNRYSLNCIFNCSKTSLKLQFQVHVNFFQNYFKSFKLHLYNFETIVLLNLNTLGKIKRQSVDWILNLDCFLFNLLSQNLKLVLSRDFLKQKNFTVFNQVWSIKIQRFFRFWDVNMIVTVDHVYSMNCSESQLF